MRLDIQLQKQRGTNRGPLPWLVGGHTGERPWDRSVESPPCPGQRPQHHLYSPSGPVRAPVEEWPNQPSCSAVACHFRVGNPEPDPSSMCWRIVPLRPVAMRYKVISSSCSPSSLRVVLYKKTTVDNTPSLVSLARHRMAGNVQIFVQKKFLSIALTFPISAGTFTAPSTIKICLPQRPKRHLRHLKYSRETGVISP